MNTIMVIDGGGRGAVLAQAYLKSKEVNKIIAVPGNDLMTQNNNVEIIPQLKTTSVLEIKKLAIEKNVDIVDL